MSYPWTPNTDQLKTLLVGDYERIVSGGRVHFVLVRPR